MLPSKKLKLLTTNYSLLIFGGIFISLFFAIVIGHFSTPVLAAIDVPAATGLSTNSLADTAVNIINAFLGLVGVIALGIFVYGGYLWMFSGGDPKKIDKAKKVLISATIGLIIILLSWAIVSFIFNALDGGDGNNGNNTGGGGGILPGASSFVRKWVDPYNGQPNVPLCRIVQAGFSDNLSPGTVNSNNVIIKEYCNIINDCDLHDDGVINTSDSCQGDNYCGYNIATSGVFNVTDKTFEFLPNKEWFENTQYRIELTANIQNFSLSEFLVSASSIFTTGTTTDNTPPQVLPNISPADGDTDVCLVKPIMVQFSEPMRVSSLKDALTLNSNDPDFASLEIDPISPAGLTFDASTPSSNTAVYYPTILYSTNQLYNPVLRAGEDTNGNKALDVGEDRNLNTKLDAIQDACLNSLDGNADGTAQGSPLDDHGDSPSDITIDPPGDNPAIANYSFTTGTTEECIPEITGITPISYYDPANGGEQITITGKNFGTIPTEVLLASNVFVNGSTNSCLDNAAVPPDTNTYTNPADFCIKSWNDGQITLIPPARDGSSNGAIDGSVQVKLGGFAACTGTCAAGRNKDKVCATADPDCPIGDSNTNFSIDIQSPHISSQSRDWGPKGQAITLAGTDFGDGDNDANEDDTDDDAVDGIVRFIRQSDRAVVIGTFPCSAISWTVSRIIVEFPIDTGAVIVNTGDVFDVQVERTDGRNSNFGTFAITAGTPGPVMCAIAPDCGPTGTSVTIDGKRFGAAGTVSFGSAASVTGPWADTQITAASPAQPTDGTYPVEVTAGGEPSNTLPFNTLCSGRPDIVLSNACPGSSPNPRPDSVNNCVNLNYTSARFTQNMDVGDLQNPAYISLWQCNTGPAFTGPCLASPGTPSHFDYDLNTDEVRFTPTAALAQNTWYEFRVSGSVRAAGPGLSMNTNKAFQFHIRDDAAPCQADKIDVLPNSWTMSVPQTRLYTANALDSNTCNVLTAVSPAPIWQSWISSNPAAATVTGAAANSDTATAVALGTANISAFLDVGTGIPLTDTSPLTITSGGGGGAVCGNGKIDAGEQCDDKNTFNNDGCSHPACQRETPAIFSVKPANLVANVCKNAAVEITFTGLINLSTITTSTVRLLQGVAPVAGSIQARYIDSDNNGAMDQTLAIIYPSSVFAGSTTYSVEVLGGLSGAKSKYGAELAATSCGAAMNWSTDHCASSFTTGTEICKIDKVSIILEKDFNPDSSIQDLKFYSGPDLFTCAGKNNCPDDVNLVVDGQNQHKATAEARDANGILLSGITYSWTKSTDAPFTMLTPSTPATLVQADPKSGIGALTVKADGGLAGIKTASTNITVMPCDNPWPGTDYPFRDVYNAVTNPNPTNFSLWYCRDAGAAGTADDLPALNMISKDGTGELIKEFFFYDAANPNDAIGLRVYNNYRRAGENYYIVPTKEWYENRASNRQGAPASAVVDGWDAVQAGRTIYVNAANHMANTSIPLSANIYLMSHSDKVSRNLLNILDQLKANWKFAITEYDDGTEGTGVGAPSNHVNKLKRDMLRRSNLFNAAVSFLQYRLSKSKYPDLPSGSYLPGHSTSIWPSWDQTLGKEIGKNLPIDPLNNLIIDQTGADKCLKANGYDSATCWNQRQTKFKCDTGAAFALTNYYTAADDDSHIYHYKVDGGAKDLNLYAEMEYVGSGDNATWRDGSHNPCGGVGTSSCQCYNYEQKQSVIEPFIISDMGLLGNGQWDYNLGEICDSSVTEGPNGLEGMKCQVGACDSHSVPAKIGQGCSGDAECRDDDHESGLCDFTPQCVNGNAYCPNGPVIIPVCGDGKVQVGAGIVENCECSNWNDNPGTCKDGQDNDLQDYYYWDPVNGNDLNNITGTGASGPNFDDVFSAPVECQPTDCRFEPDPVGNGNPTLAEPGNGIFEPWAENCEPNKGYCSISQTVCNPLSNSPVCPGGETCIALGNGGFYCDGGSSIQCVPNGAIYSRRCPLGESVTSCMHTVPINEWENCGGTSLPAKPYNYLQTDLWGWCFR